MAHKLIDELNLAYENFHNDSFISSAACDTLIQSLLQTFFIKQGCVFSIVNCPSTLEKAISCFFGPDGPFIKAVYLRYLRAKTSYKVPLDTISPLYAELATINPVMLPHYYSYKMTKSADGDLLLNVLEYTIVMICSVAISCRVSSKEENITYKVRGTPYNKLILAYLQALRKRGSIMYELLAIEDIQKADDMSMQPSCTISLSPFSSTTFPRTVGDLFISLASDCWFARNIPISMAEQISVPIEILQEVCQSKEVSADATSEEKSLHARALTSTHYRTLAYDCTHRPVTDRPCFLTNILDLAYLFARYVVSPAASLNYGALDTLQHIGETIRRNLSSQWTNGSPPQQHFSPMLAAGGKKYVCFADDSQPEGLKWRYVIRNGSHSILTYLVNVENANDKLTSVGGRFLRLFAPPYSETVETRVLPTFYAFLRSLFQGEPVVNKVYLYLLMSRIYGETLCLDPSRLSSDTELYLSEGKGKFQCSAEDEKNLCGAIAIRAPFYSALSIEWTQHVASVHIRLLMDSTQSIAKGAIKYGSLWSLFNLRSFYCQNHYKPIQHLVALHLVSHWLTHSFVEPVLSSLGAIASRITPLDFEIDALLFTARARALMTYTACEPILCLTSSEGNERGSGMMVKRYSENSSIQDMHTQIIKLRTSKCLLDINFLARSLHEASQALLEDCQYLSFNIPTRPKDAADFRTRNMYYFSLDSKGIPIDTKAHKGHSILTGYIGLLDISLARSGEEHLPHTEDKLFFREYMNQFIRYSGQVKTYLSHLNHANNITLSRALSLQFGAFPIERLLLRLAGWHHGHQRLIDVFSISHIYNIIQTDITRDFTRIMSSEKEVVYTQKRSKRLPADRPMDVIISPEYRQLRAASGELSALKYAAYCTSNSATKILINSGLLEDRSGDLSYSMLSAVHESTGYTPLAAHPVRPDEFATMIIILDVLAVGCNYLLSMFTNLLYIFYKSPRLQRRVNQGFMISFRVLANKKLWGLILLIGLMVWLLRILIF